jgi:hypothetical protein
MNDSSLTIDKSLYDALVAYIIQSSSALHDTAKALALDPLHAARVVVLTESLDSAKVLLSKVVLPFSNIIRYLPLFIADTRPESKYWLAQRKRR